MPDDQVGQTRRLRRSTLALVGCTLVAFSAKPASAQIDGIIRNLLQNAAPQPYRPPPPVYAPPPGYDPYYRSPPVEPYPRYSVAPQAPRGSAGSANTASQNSGKYCIDNNTTMLLTRRTSQGIQFALNSWSGRGRLFSVGGFGSAVVGGYEYASNMSSPTLGERCHVHLDIRSDGGYVFWIGEDGPCSESQGFSYPPNVKVVFPARSRRGGIAPNKSIEEAGSMGSGGESCK